MSVRQKLTALTKKVGGSLECHLCIAGMYSYVLLRLAPDRFYQQSTVAEKYLDEDKKKLEMIKKTGDDQITDTKRSFFSQGLLSLRIMVYCVPHVSPAL